MFVLAALAGLLAGAGLRSQTSSEAPPQFSEVRTLLDNATVKDQTWGAWWVAAGHYDQFEPELRANLEAALDPARGRNGYYNQFALDATLDALIQLGHNDLPPELLAAAYKERPEAAIILAAESSLPTGSVDPFLRDVVNADRTTRAGAWAGAADLLVLHHAPGTVAAVLRHITFTAHVVLCDAGVAAMPHETTATALQSQDCGRIGGGGYGGSWPSSFPAPDYPPWIHYDLVLPSRGEAAKARYTRESALSPNRQYPVIPPDTKVVINGGTDETSLVYVRYAGMSQPTFYGPTTVADKLAIVTAAGPKETVPVIEGATLVVPWHGDASAQATIAEFRQTLQRRYATMIGALQASGALTAGEALELKSPVIQIVTDDRRK